MMRSTLTVADVALVPEGDVFQRGDGVAAQHAGQAGEAFPGDGVALVRHGAATFLALGERLLGFEHFGALEMAELDGPAFDARADERQRGHEIRRGCRAGRPAWRWARAAGRAFCRRKPRRAATDARWCRRRRKVCRRRRLRARASSRSQRAAKFVVHQRQLQAEGGRLGVDAVAAADARRELVFLARLRR